MRGTSMDEQKMESQTVGVVGPGRMGIGIATAILAGGPHHQVHLFDMKKREAGKEEEALLSAGNEIQTNLRLLQELGLTSGSPDKALPSLSLAVSYTHLRAHETKANLVCRLLLEKKK